MQPLTNAAVAGSISDIVTDLGSIPLDRIHADPPPGKATMQDVLRVNASGGNCELVDGTLVEKAMGWRESLIAAFLIEIIGRFSRSHNLGVVTGPDGFLKILGSLVRGPDVAFFSWERLPNQQLPEESIPECVPDLAIEVLSRGNTLAEMSRKRREYFHAGVQLVWMVDPRQRTVAVYTSLTDYVILGDSQRISGQQVLPGLTIELAELFAELDRRPPG